MQVQNFCKNMQNNDNNNATNNQPTNNDREQFVNIDKAQLGQVLLQQGFSTWFLYMFRVLEGRPFIVEPIHDDLFQVFDDIYDLKTIRQSINIPPRAGKTTLATYLCLYCITKQPRANFIYTSFSQFLLTDIAKSLMSKLESPIYKALYPQDSYFSDDHEFDAIDAYWRDEIMRETGKNKYNSRYIRTRLGGTLLFASIGSAITGFGAGIRGYNKFGGALIIDDANKPANITSKILRENVVRYFEETLLSRLNNSNTPIVNIQQRLHPDDLTGTLIEKYGFQALRKPLLSYCSKGPEHLPLDISKQKFLDGYKKYHKIFYNGDIYECALPQQYSYDRLRELMQNKFVFEAQYQQNPQVNKGAVINIDWFRYYRKGDIYPSSSTERAKIKMDQLMIFADTGSKKTKKSDYSVFGVCGKSSKDMYILDWHRGKMSSPEMRRLALRLWERWGNNRSGIAWCKGIGIEDRASGMGLIQDLQELKSIPIYPITAELDKVARIERHSYLIEEGHVFLPEGPMYSWVPCFLDECACFSRDDSHKNDDQVDVFGYALHELLGKYITSIYDVLYTPQEVAGSSIPYFSSSPLLNRFRY